jgi:hypothetical protein
MPNRRYNTQVAPQFKAGGRVKRMGGGMSTARRDMRSGYYKNDMGMKGGKMYKEGGKVKGSEHPLAGREGNVKHRLKSQKQYKAITDTKKYKDASYNEKQKMLDAGGAYTKSAPDQKSRTSRAKGGRVGKKKQGYKDRKDESIAMRIRKKRTAKQLKASRDDSYGRFGSKAKKSGKINR